MGSDEDEGAVDELKQMTAREQQSILSLTWLLDSISAFRLMDRELYIL